MGSIFILVLTLLPGLSDDIRSALAHHLGDIQRAVGLVGYSHRAVNSLRLHLEYRRVHFNRWR